MQGKTLRDQQWSKDRQRSDEMTKIEVGRKEEMITVGIKGCLIGVPNGQQAE